MTAYQIANLETNATSWNVHYNIGTYRYSVLTLESSRRLTASWMDLEFFCMAARQMANLRSVTALVFSDLYSYSEKEKRYFFPIIPTPPPPPLLRGLNLSTGVLSVCPSLLLKFSLPSPLFIHFSSKDIFRRVQHGYNWMYRRSKTSLHQ